MDDGVLQTGAADVAASHGGVPVSVGPLGHVKQPHVGPHRLAGLADFYEHVAVHLGDLTPRYAGPQVEPVTVLGHDVGDLGLLVQHEQRHVGSGGLGQAQVTRRDLLALTQATVTTHTPVRENLPDPTESRSRLVPCSREYWH